MSTCSSRQEILIAADSEEFKRNWRLAHGLRTLEGFTVTAHYIGGISQKYSIPLVSGVLTALIWSNVEEDSYHKFNDSSIIPGAEILGHDLSLHFIINDLFMCLFFGLAVKEVTEAFLTGGSLNPISRAINPIFATVGGVLGPIAIFVATLAVMDGAGVFEGTDCSEGDPGASAAHRRLAGDGTGSASSGTGSSSLVNATMHHNFIGAQDDTTCNLMDLMHGWGVPTATDISLAWMFSMQVFDADHPAINFMLLLAILDDAIGMVIIAVFYSDPAKPVEPLWLLLVLVAIVLGVLMRKLSVRKWWAYILICVPFSWTGLMKAHVHPALALVFVVPCMPARRALYLRGSGWLEPARQGDIPAAPAHPLERRYSDRDTPAAPAQPIERRCSERETPAAPAQPLEGRYSDRDTPKRVERSKRSDSTLDSTLERIRVSSFFTDQDAPLHVFESTLKAPVDFGMFFFGLANAGVSFGSIGGLTGAVIIALCIGKMVGIFAFSLLASCLGFDLPHGLSFVDLLAMSALAGVGLTVSLFLANEAYVQPELQAQAKMGAVFSVGCGFVGWLIRQLARFGSTEDKDTEMDEEQEQEDGDNSPLDAEVH
jgi:Na+/H+ antiporter NhaA